MAFDTGKVNPSEGPLGIKYLGQTSGRLIKENEGIVNAADWIQEVVTPGSGTNLNIDASSMTIVVEQDPGAFIRTFENGRVLFSSNFSDGFDTFTSWHLVYNNFITLPGKVNDSDTSGTGSIGPVNFLEGCLPAVIDYTGTDNESQWAFVSQTPMKTGSYENIFTVCKGTFADSSHTGVTTPFFVFRVGGFDDGPVIQGSWNLDTLDGSGDANNPSGAELFLDGILTFCILESLNSSGPVKMGFIVNGDVIFCHQFGDSVSTSLIPGFSKSPLRVVGGIEAGDCVLRVGHFDEKQGYMLKVVSAISTGSNPEYSFYEVTCSATGANRNDFFRTFTNGNKFNFRNVGQTEVPLVSLKPKLTFPIAAPAQNNKTVFSISSIKISGTSLDLNQAVYVSVYVFWGVITDFLAGSSFTSNGDNSSVLVDTVATFEGGALALATERYSDVVYPNNSPQMELEIPGDKLDNFMNQYTCTTIDGDGVSVINVDPIITVSARTKDAATIDLTAQIIWKEK